MLKVILLAAVAVFSFAGSADAATITITLGATDTYATGGTVVGDVNLGSTQDPVSGLTLGGDAQIVPAGSSVSGLNASPTGTLYGGTYLYATGNAGSSATFSLSGTTSTFGLTWGTIDSYNTLTLTDAKGNVFAVTGAGILNNIAGLTSGTSQLNVVVDDPFADLTKAVLTSSENSFEAGNFSASLVPLPPAFLFFASGLVALTGFAMVKKAGRQI